MKLEVRDNEGIPLRDLVSEAMKGVRREGAILLFVGLTKGKGKGGRDVSHVEVEIDEGVEESLGPVLKGLEERFGSEVRLLALKGRFEVGEPLTVILATAEDRERAFATLRGAVEAYKSDPHVRLKEVYKEGNR